MNVATPCILNVMTSHSVMFWFWLSYFGTPARASRDGVRRLPIETCLRNRMAGLGYRAAGSDVTRGLPQTM